MNIVPRVNTITVQSVCVRGVYMFVVSDKKLNDISSHVILSTFLFYLETYCSKQDIQSFL